MSKFKRGDRVRRVNYANDKTPVGSMGTVLDFQGGKFRVDWDHRHINKNWPDNLELITETPNTMNLTVTKDKVVEAASKCSTANSVLRVMFPEAFEPEKPEPYRFRDGHVLPYGLEGPLVIMSFGDYCPDGLGDKCLMVGKDYRLETQEYKGQTILTFYKK